jgi:NAD(P)-dependent dehydrogenase (short-subunit alcohol dehydrogenase family)
VLAGKVALVTGGSGDIDQRIREAPDPGCAAVVVSFVCNLAPLKQVAAAVETAGGGPPAMKSWRGRAVAVGGPE